MGMTMQTSKFRRRAPGLAALFLSAAALTEPALAEDYNSAKAAGLIGERMDGYVGVVGAGTPELRRIADDTNIKRKAVYAEQAQSQHATVEEYAFTSGCLLIAKTSPGMKYQAPDGSWKTRTTAPPLRDSRCP